MIAGERCDCLVHYSEGELCFRNKTKEKYDKSASYSMG